MFLFGIVKFMYNYGIVLLVHVYLDSAQVWCVVGSDVSNHEQRIQQRDVAWNRTNEKAAFDVISEKHAHHDDVTATQDPGLVHEHEMKYCNENWRLTQIHFA